MDRTHEASEYANSRSHAAIQNKPMGAPEPATDADFKSYVLYVTPAAKRSQNCRKALEALALNPSMKIDTLIQDVEALASKPTWLDSAPCLVVKSERRAFKDEAAVKWILENVQKTPSAYGRSKGTGHKNNAW